MNEKILCLFIGGIMCLGSIIISYIWERCSRSKTDISTAAGCQRAARDCNKQLADLERTEAGNIAEAGKLNKRAADLIQEGKEILDRMDGRN